MPGEMDIVTDEIDRTLNNLEEWMAPRHKPRDLVHIGNKVYSVENTDTIGTKESVLIREVSSFQVKDKVSLLEVSSFQGLVRLKKVPLLERCPHFR